MRPIIFLTIFVIYNKNAFGKLAPLSINPEKAEPHSHKFMITLMKHDGLQKSDHFCGGTLLRVPCMENESNLVLTAAHCILGNPLFHPLTCKGGRPLLNAVAVAGKHNLSKTENGQVKQKIVEARCHEDFDLGNNSVPDIAILKLIKSIKFSENIQPVILSKSAKNLTNSSCKVVGWGAYKLKTEEKPGVMNIFYEYPNELQELSMKAMNDEFCQTLYSYSKFDKEKMMCALRQKQNDHKGVCYGDSGGPLMCKEEGSSSMTQEGIVSYGYGYCAQPSLVLPRVSAYKKWIKEKVTEMACPKG